MTTLKETNQMDYEDFDAGDDGLHTTMDDTYYCEACEEEQPLRDTIHCESCKRAICNDCAGSLPNGNEKFCPNCLAYQHTIERITQMRLSQQKYELGLVARVLQRITVQRESAWHVKRLTGSPAEYHNAISLSQLLGRIEYQAFGYVTFKEENQS